MNAIVGVVRNRRIEIEVPEDWIDGTSVMVLTVPPKPPADVEPESPEAIEAWLKWYDSLEPLEFTAEEEADLQRSPCGPRLTVENRATA